MGLFRGQIIRPCHEWDHLAGSCTLQDMSCLLLLHTDIAACPSCIGSTSLSPCPSTHTTHFRWHLLRKRSSTVLGAVWCCDGSIISCLPEMQYSPWVRWCLGSHIQKMWWCSMTQRRLCTPNETLQAVVADSVPIPVWCNYFISQDILYAVYFFHSSKLFIGKSVKHFKSAVTVTIMEKILAFICWWNN